MSTSTSSSAVFSLPRLSFFLPLVSSVVHDNTTGLLVVTLPNDKKSHAFDCPEAAVSVYPYQGYLAITIVPSPSAKTKLTLSTFSALSNGNSRRR